MDALLLTILILVGDPSGEPLAQALAQDLSQRGGAQVRVVAGAEAAKQLEARGVKPRDLLVSPNIGAHLTAGQDGKPSPLIVLHLDRREAAGDTLVETRAWLDGRSDRHVAIAGKGGDPTGAVIGGVQGLIGHRLPQGKDAAAHDGPPDDVQLAQLAERRQWTELLGRLAGAKERTPRQAYYEVLAYVRLGQRDAAVEALNRLRAQAPDHFLVPAAAELIPPAAGAAAGAAAADDGGNTLRDAPAAADDGGNTLR